jgi:hypothetical protein
MANDLPMELRDLNGDERLALVGLMKAVVLSDGEVSDDEIEHVETLVDAFGEKEYQRMLDAFEQRFPDEAAFKKFLETIGRQDARELIFATVLEGADEGGIEGGETELLDWLSDAWNVTIEIADDAAG